MCKQQQPEQEEDEGGAGGINPFDAFGDDEEEAAASAAGKSNPFGNNNDDDVEKVKSQIDLVFGELNHSQMLYIPGNMHFTWHNKGNKEAICMRWCFSDASNFDKTKKVSRLCIWME